MAEQQKCILSWFWRLEIQDQGTGKVILPLKAVGKDLFRESLLVSGSSLACSILPPTFTLRSPCVCVCLFTRHSSLDTSYIRSDTHQTPVWAHVNSTDYICSHLSHLLRLELRYINLGNTQFICTKCLTFFFKFQLMSHKWWPLRISEIGWINKYEHLAQHLPCRKYSTHDKNYCYHNSEHILCTSVLLSVKLGQEYLLGRIPIILKWGITYACAQRVFLHWAET